MSVRTASADRGTRNERRESTFAQTSTSVPRSIRGGAWFGVLLLFASLGSTSTAAGLDELPFWPDVVDTLEVTSRPDALRERLDLQPGFSTLIPLGPEVSASRDLSDLVDQVAGVHVHRYGGLGAFSTASVRGSSAAQIRVVLDGVPLASARDGVANLGLVPLSLLDHALVHRGAQTLPLSGPPAAGVIELHTPPAAAAPPVVGFSLGSHGTRSVRGHWGRSVGNWGLFLAGQRRTTDGDFSYLDRKGTDHNLDDDATVDRSNNDHLDESLLWKTSFEPTGRISVDYTGQRLLRDGGVAGTESIQTTTTRYRSERVRHQLQFGARPALPRTGGRWGRPRIHVMAFLDGTADHFSNPNGEVGLGLADEESTLETVGGEFGIELPLVPWGLHLGTVHSWNEESWTPYDRLHDLEEYTRERDNRTSAVSARWHGFSRRLTVDAGYRWDRATDNYGGPVVFGRPPEPSPARNSRFEAPTFGLRVGLGHGFSLHGNRGRYLRRPTFPELFGQNGVQDGNPVLRPEKGLQWDTGLRLTRSGLRASLAYYESVTEDEILLLQNSQRTVKAQNVDRTWVRGVESSALFGVSLPRNLRLEIVTQATWQEARDRGSSRTYRGREIPYLPETEVYGSASVRSAEWAVEYGVSRRSAVYRDRYNTEAKRADGQSLHDLGLEHDLFHGRTTVRLEIQNLWDYRSQDIEGYPLPGRTALIEFIVRPLPEREEAP